MKTKSFTLAWTLSLFLALSSIAAAQPGTVLSHQKISDSDGSFTGILDDSDEFGSALATLGDLDGDGVTDLAIGARFDDDGGSGPLSDRGAVWILFMNADGTAKSEQKISDTEGGFAGILDDEDTFGHSLASLGDLDGDGVPDLAVGAQRDDDGGANRGTVWILFLKPDGTVKSYQKISDTEGNFTGTLDNEDRFGFSLANIGDLDGDGVTDLAVGANADDDGGSDHGAVWVLFLNDDGTVKSHQKISDTEGNFTGVLSPAGNFGGSLAVLGDLDGDDILDLAVGASSDDDGGTDRGAVWVLFLNDDGTVKSHQKISDTEGGFSGALDNADIFGSSLAAVSDIDGDGVLDLAVGAFRDDDGGSSSSNRGAVWVLFLKSDGTVKSHQKISDTEGNFTGILDDEDDFGFSLATLGDLDGDCVTDLAVGAEHDDDGGTDRGAVWALFLDGMPSADNDPPVITVAVPINLWPPNHKYQTITVAQCVTAVSDNCASLSVNDVVITQVTSDEPEDAPGGGDGNTTNDIVIASDCKSVQLRRERQGSDNGRVYTIHLTLNDGNGNEGTATCLVTAPHDQSGAPAVDDGPSFSVTGSCGGGSSPIAGIASDRISIGSAVPEVYGLQQNYPNPFNPSTQISFAMPEPGTVKLQIYNIAGQLIQTLVQGAMPAGRHSLIWNGRDQPGVMVASGIYFYQLVVQGRTGETVFVETRKMNLIK
jgi:hypothetical protein